MPPPTTTQPQKPEPHDFVDEPQIDLRALLGVIRRRKWTVVWTVVIVICVTLLVVLLLEKKYTATALIVVDPRDSQMLGFEPGTVQSFGIPGGGTGLVDTEVEIARSQTVLRRAAGKLDLANSPEFSDGESILGHVMSVIGLRSDTNQSGKRDETLTELSEEKQTKIVERLSKVVDITRRGFTNIIEISASRASPEKAAATANALADAYLEEQLAAKLESNERAVTFLRDRVDQLAHLIRDGEAQIDRLTSAAMHEEVGTAERGDSISRLESGAGAQINGGGQFGEISLELFNLQRNVETNRALYDGYLSNMRSLEQQVDFRFSDARVVAPAIPPARSSFPPTNLILSGAFFISLGLGIGLAFLRENMIGNIISVEQLEYLGGVPVLAGVPHYSGDKSDLAIVSETLSPFCQAIRKIRFGVDSLLEADHRCICVTSALQGEGKTTIAMCLARQYAMTGSATLLIDADLRHPGVHQYLNGESSSGLTDFLSTSQGDSPEAPATTREPETGVEYLLGKPQSASVTDAMLRSSRFNDLMKFARSNYDVVILDAPPAGMALDAAIVARYSDLCILVARYARTRQFQVLDSLRDLSRAGTPLCALLNQIPQTEFRQYVHGR